MKLPPSYKAGAPNAIVLFDAYNYLFRAYHALPPLTTKQGEPVGALFGFIRTIIKIMKTLKPASFVVCWDSRPTERLALDQNYKAHRPETPQDLKLQIAAAKELLGAWELPLIKVSGAEADDVMATVALKAHHQGRMSYLITSDKDILQLVNENITAYQESKDLWMTPEEVQGKYGVAPKQLIDYFSLIGDSVDNIPGIPGVGPATARKLLNEYGSIEGIREAMMKRPESIPAKLTDNFIENGERLERNRSLVRLKSDVALDLDWEAFTISPQPKPRLDEQLIRCGFLSIREDLKKLGWIESGAGEHLEPPFAANQALGVPEPAVHAEGLTGVVLEEAIKTAPSIEKLLSESPAVKIVHGFKDFLRRHHAAEKILSAGEILDTRLMAWVINPTEESYGLDWLLSKYGVSGISGLALRLKKDLQETALWNLYESVELPLALVLERMERAGISVNEKHLLELNRTWELEARRLKERFIKESGASEEINLNSPKQLSQLFFEKLKLPVIRKTKTGFSTDEEVLQKLSGRHPSIRHLLEFREVSKLRSTFVEGLLHAIDPKSRRIHATFDQEGTETGRVSCRSPNLQNIPVRTDRGLCIREAFVAGEPGWELASLDYSQIDLRVFAHLSGDAALIEFFRSGRDIHEETARAVLGVGNRTVTPEERRHAKAITFGILYGMGPFGLAQDLGITDDEAHHIIETYYQRFPGVWDWRERTLGKAQKDGFAVTILGRRRPLPLLGSERRGDRGHAERAAVNTPVQGSSADIIKLAMIRLDEYLRSSNSSLRMLLQVHDEILLEGPKSELGIRLPELARIMAEAMKLDVPLVVNAKKGANWRHLAPIV
ncbi:MAG: hypothetical protein HY547_08235 [Elusimicrobia bacterium]|nr:hypothetical protein [Elusimicrobiota bacterium]